MAPQDLRQLQDVFVDHLLPKLSLAALHSFSRACRATWLAAQALPDLALASLAQASSDRAQQLLSCALRPPSARLVRRLSACQSAPLRPSVTSSDQWLRKERQSEQGTWPLSPGRLGHTVQRWGAGAWCHL